MSLLHFKPSTAKSIVRSFGQRRFSAAASSHSADSHDHQGHGFSDSWWRLGKVLAAFGAGMLVKALFFDPHPHEQANSYPYTHISGKEFPWGDGKTPLFIQVFHSKKHGDHSEHGGH